MDMPSANDPSTNPKPAPALLADAYLSILGYALTTDTKARRHLRSIATALEHPLPPEIRAGILAQKTHIEDAWGTLTLDPEKGRNLKVAPAEYWLRTRQKQEATFGTLKRAAQLLLTGETSFSRVHCWSFGPGRPRMLVTPVSVHTFRRWLMRTGIVHQTGQMGVYGPGEQAQRISAMEWREMESLISAGQNEI
jgi:hypothetical protein